MEGTTTLARPVVPEVDAEGRCIWCADDHTPGAWCTEKALAYAELARAPRITLGGVR